MHVPVLLDEVVAALRPERGGCFVDCTVGLGGHARALVERGAMRLIGIDRDPAALEGARAVLHAWADRVDLVHADYRDIDAVLDARGVAKVRGIVADLGVSSLQLDAPGRGFSFRRDEPLDMRMDPTRGPTAAERLAAVDEADLADAIFRYGEERRSRRIARALVAARARGPLETTGQVADVVRRAIGAADRRGRRGGGRAPHRIDPATRTFQALRIWVNAELEGLDRFIAAAVGRLDAGGRLAVISFHSIEDRIVKHTMRGLAGREPAVARVLTRRPVTAGDAEVHANPRARSAKLRVAERVD